MRNEAMAQYLKRAYPQYFIDSMEKIGGNDLVKVNFDIHAFVATARGS
jgi:hypothetical protein